MTRLASTNANLADDREVLSANEPLRLRDEIEAVGGTIAGVVVNRPTYNPPAVLKRLTG